MKFGICLQALIPQRKEARESSEMINQLLLGDHYMVVSETDKWVEIETCQDAYLGYIDAKCHTAISKEQYEQWKNTPKACVQSLQQVMVNDAYHWVTPGSHLPQINLNWFAHNYRMDTVAWTEVAHQFLNVPYLWGGKNMLGIDCSGFTQCVAYSQNIAILRDAYQQAEQGTPCEQKNGALAFFVNSKQKITHVGIVINNNEIIHASGKVRIDTLTDQGIVHATSQKITHTLSHFRCIGL